VNAGTNDTFKESRELQRSAQKTLDEINKYVSQLDETERALSSVGRADIGNLRKRYESFSTELEKLEKAQARAGSNIDRMRTTGAEYFSSWDKANARISDAELRQAGASRRARVLERHRDLADAVSEIRVELQPFMSDLRDLKTFLGADLSPRNVSKASELIRESQVEAETLHDRVAVVQTKLKQFLKETPE